MDRIGGDKATEHWRPVGEIDLRSNVAQVVRYSMVSHMARKRPNITPHNWQVDCAVCIALGYDILGISGTGSGKSLVYQLLAGIPNSTHIVISPITGLVEAQAKALNDVGISAIGLTADSMQRYTGSLWDDIAACRYTFVISSPEVLLHSESEFWLRMVRERDNNLFLQRLRSITVDEAHMVWKWGGVVDSKTQKSFRSTFKEIGNFRVLFPDIPFLMLSATITPVVRGYLYKVMKLHSPAYISRCSIQRTNIRVLFGVTEGAMNAKTFKELDFLVDHVRILHDMSVLPKFMVYTDERNRCQDIVKYLRNCMLKGFELDSDRPDRARLREVLVPYTGMYDEFTNSTNLANLGKGICRGMVCTEAAGKAG